eukprot:TRINITY_DN2843_c0_g2_i2.p1 TRINITY_DN2843_c0_g2~~TRINITY_DN2843_c0_g2_i2.p1  ORF type:complete len:645 (-),score=36.14 TRINITY_DN2843_c0_g2_i2:94-2028(-)
MNQLTEPIRFTLPRAARSVGEETCAFWDEELQVWSNRGMSTGPVNLTQLGPLVCTTTHLTLFGAVIGEFKHLIVDAITTVSCSNVEAILSEKAFRAIIHNSSWLTSWPAVALSAFTLLCMLAMVNAGKRDADNDPQEHALMRSENAPSVGRKMAANASGPSFCCKAVCRAFRLVTWILDWLAMGIPSLLQSILYDGFIDVSTQMISHCIRMILAYEANVSQDTLCFLAEMTPETGEEAQEQERLQSHGQRVAEEFLGMCALRRVLLIFPSVNPWMTSCQVCAYSSCASRCAVVVSKLFGAFAASAAFASASGNALSSDSDASCAKREGVLAHVARTLAVAVVAEVVSGKFCLCLEVLGQRSIVRRRCWDDAAKLWQRRIWRLKRYMFYTVWFSHFSFCFVFVIAFIANVNSMSGMELLYTCATANLIESILKPLIISVALSFLLSVVLVCRPTFKERFFVTRRLSLQERCYRVERLPSLLSSTGEHTESEGATETTIAAQTRIVTPCEGFTRRSWEGDRDADDQNLDARNATRSRQSLAFDKLVPLEQTRIVTPREGVTRRSWEGDRDADDQNLDARNATRSRQRLAFDELVPFERTEGESGADVIQLAGHGARVHVESDPPRSCEHTVGVCPVMPCSGTIMPV